MLVEFRCLFLEFFCRVSDYFRLVYVEVVFFLEEEIGVFFFSSDEV